MLLYLYITSKKYIFYIAHVQFNIIQYTVVAKNVGQYYKFRILIIFWKLKHVD